MTLKTKFKRQKANLGINKKTVDYKVAVVWPLNQNKNSVEQTLTNAAITILENVQNCLYCSAAQAPILLIYN